MLLLIIAAIAKAYPPRQQNKDEACTTKLPNVPFESVEKKPFA